MGIGYRIKEARERLGLTQTELGNIVGVTGSAITNYEKETSHPKEQVIYRLMEALNVDANYLFQDAVKLPHKKNDVSLAEYNMVKRYRALDPPGQSHVDAVLQWETERMEQIKQPVSPAATRAINYYYRLASAGTGQIVFDMPPTKRIDIPDIPEYKKADYAIGVNGDSMEPVYHDGDTLLVEMTDSIEPEEIGIFLVDGESFVKKLGEEELISLNPGSKNVPLNESARCLGRVIGKL